MRQVLGQCLGRLWKITTDSQYSKFCENLRSDSLHRDQKKVASDSRVICLHGRGLID